MVEVAIGLIQTLLISLVLTIFFWIISLVIILIVGGKELSNNIKLFLYNRFRNGRFGLVRIVGQDMNEKTYVKKVDSLMEIENGNYGGTANVTFFRGSTPIRQHIRGVFNAVDLLQRKTREVMVKLPEKIACPNCNQTIQYQAQELPTDIPQPELSDSSDLIKHTIVQAQTTSPQGYTNPKVIQWIAIGLIGTVFGVAILVLFSQPEFVKALISIGGMR